MLSKNKTRLIVSLQKKKAREEERLFVIEGDKLVKEFLAAGRTVRMLIAKPEFIKSLPESHTAAIGEIDVVNYEELKIISSLRTPHNALAVLQIPDYKIDTSDVFKGISVALDCVQDPGNLGTIIRAAGWFGIKNIICSEDCVDVYNPKVIQASMGAILHVKVFYSDLKTFLFSANKYKIPVYGTMLEGKSVYSHDLNEKSVILLGNESKGISEELIPFINERIMIPKFSSAQQGIDSLNVGMAASIIFSEFLRKSAGINN